MQLMIQNGGDTGIRSGSGKQKIVHRTMEESEKDKLVSDAHS